jgi:ubiquinone/menaquinone biosynthesis C-methylase UbiE
MNPLASRNLWRQYTGCSNMSLLVPTRRFDPTVPEMMDRGDADPVMLCGDLKNLRTINRLFGGLRTVRRSILPLFRKIRDGREVRILDLATGSADHPLALVELARRTMRKVHITAVDRNPFMLQVSRERTGQHLNIAVEEKDLLCLDYEPASFDIVICSLAIHHFSRDDAVRIVRSMHRLSRVGFIVNDLSRSWVAAWSVNVYTHLTSRNPMTLYDSYNSVLRAFTPREFEQIALDAGISTFKVETHPFFRLVLVGEH